MAYQNAEVNLLIFMGTIASRIGTFGKFGPSDFDAELTNEKPFIVWYFDDETLHADNVIYEEEICRERTRSKNFKHPFILAVTQASNIDSAVKFLIEQATEKMTLG